MWQVDAYEQGRPSYPQEGLKYALKELGLDQGLPKKAVDLAAGTGKLTRSEITQIKATSDRCSIPVFSLCAGHPVHAQ